MIRGISLLPLLGAIISASLILVVLWNPRSRSTRRVRYFVLLNLSVAIWSLAYFVVLNLGLDLDPALMRPDTFAYWAYAVEVAGIAGAPTYWFLFAAVVARRRWWTHGRGFALAHAYAVYTLLVLWTNPFHRLAVAGQHADGTLHFGPLVGPHFLGVYVMVPAGTWFLASMLWRKHTREGRRDATILAIASAIPLAGSVATSALRLADMSFELNLVPVFFPVLNIILGHLILRAGFAEILPHAASEAFHTMSDATLVLDTRGVIRSANEAVERSFPGVMTGRRLSDVSPVVAERVAATRAANAEEFEVEVDGRCYWGRVHPMRPQWNRSTGNLLMLTDVTDVRDKEERLRQVRDSLEDRVRERTSELEMANQELRKATLAKDQFLANVSHELRTPLSSIIGFTDAMIRGTMGNLDEGLMEKIRVINTAGKHQRAIIDDLLDLSRIRIGKTDVSTSEFSLTSFVNLLVGMTRSLAHEEGLEFTVEAPSYDLVLCSDEDKIRQILLNLITNAVKFTDEGKVTLRVETHEADTVSFQVSDTGPGIPEAELSTIMDEFVQVERADGMSPPGTGLGLAISHGLAQMLGGDLTVDSVVGEGSTFTLTVPVDVSGFVSSEPALP